MFRKVGLFIVSIIITNWIYSEILIFYPSFENVYNGFMSAISLPTHKDWTAISDSNKTESLNSTVMGCLSDFPDGCKSIGKAKNVIVPRKVLALHFDSAKKKGFTF